MNDICQSLLALIYLLFSTITQGFQMGWSITDLFCKDSQYLGYDSEAIFNFTLRLLSDFFQTLVAGTRLIFYQTVTWHIQKKKKTIGKKSRTLYLYAAF